MSVSEKFQKFCNNIKISQDYVDTIQYRYERITQSFNESYWKSQSKNNHSLYVGSYGRDTDIHVSDIDMLLILPSSEFDRINNYSGNKQYKLLYEVKDSILHTYPNTKLVSDRNVIVVNFEDGIKFEIVPCFMVDGKDEFAYPDTYEGGKWKFMNPRKEIKAIKEMNNESNKNLKRLCRMVRAWKSYNGIKISGILIDTLCYRFIENYEHKHKSFLYYDWMIRDFFYFLSQLDKSQERRQIPGSGDRAYKKGGFIDKAKEGYEISLKAVKYDSESESDKANNKRREIFGSIFNR